MEPPTLPYDFKDAQITNVALGARREFTLTLTVLIWDGPNGRNLEGVKLRFGGVKNLAETAQFFAKKPHERSELAWLRYDYEQRSKPGNLHFELAFERIDAGFKWSCSSLTVTDPREGPRKGV